MRASAMLKGAMGEISRHIAVNNAEIESLRQEKSNINRKYLELVAQNQAESTQQYLKSLETNGATRYLLGIQEDVVKNETELRALKRDLEQKKGRLTELTTRLNYLSDNRRSVSDEGGLEVIMQTNEQIKHELADIGDRLSLSYKQHKTILDTIDQLDNKRLRIQELIIETLQKYAPTKEKSWRRAKRRRSLPAAKQRKGLPSLRASWRRWRASAICFSTARKI